ncbi:septum formation family protein [Saccharomonospora sp.]|uniref:septum formation family protein n=1 Tax=Saccharomonospora sp. TaxID=33913 RepID=UPI002627BBDA|nr:septum formation family protein [Saccharomonospora sp.]
MSDQPDRPPIDSALRTRVLMSGAFLGALIAMALSWMFSWVPESPQMVQQRQAEEKAEQIAKAREEAFRAPPGSCLNWTDPEASDVHRVSCDEEHYFEVVGLADLPFEYGPNAPLPDDETWHELTEEHCGGLVEEYLDKPLDPEGKLTIGVLRPDETQWADGDRTLHCGLQWVGPGGGLQVLTQPAKEIDQSNVWEPGTCLGLVDKSVGDPVPCDEQHSYEIVALVDLGEEFDSYPSREKQTEWLDPTCAELVEEYTGGKKVEELAEEGLILGWDTRSEESWAAGSTLVNCKVGAVLEDDTGLAPVQGSVKDSEDDAEEDGEQGEGDAEQDEDGAEDGQDAPGDGSGGGDQDGRGDGEPGPSNQAPAPSGAPGSGD